ncbi:MAG TPA: aminodeoxychorismate lyase [Alphaproteobacteria bacterium]|jgi:4-amino-4-deoxychorismate lyase|nr:aminodeoxychorismate lyase [Alphaproteobacteria bacterium]
MAEIPILVDGEATSQVAVLDRGFQYGDGLFETIKVTQGTAEFWDRHMARLAFGCARLGMPAPDAAALRHDAERLHKGAENGVLKIIVTRGEGGRGYNPPVPALPRRVVALFPPPGHPESWRREGVRLRLCETTLGDQPRLAGLKHLNRLEQILARSEWSDAETAEGLMCDGSGAVIEGTMSNLFLVRGGELHTPDLSRCGVAGIIRAAILEMARGLGFHIEVRRIERAELDAADEVFVTNSVIGIWPVQAIEKRKFRPGPITADLIATLAQVTKDRSEKAP